MRKYVINRRESFGMLALAAAAVGALSVHATARAADVVSTWIDQAAGTGNWNVAANWSNSPNVAQFPNNGNGGFTYDAIVNSPLANTITLGQDIVLQRFTLNGASINGANAITVNESMSFTNGALRNGTITIAPGGTFTLAPTQPRIAMTATWHNFGTGTWTGGGITGDQFAALGVFNNHAGATFYANNSFASQRAFGIGSFINAGTLLKTAGTESRWGNITPVDNTGTVEVRTGTIRFVGPIVQVQSGVLTAGSWIVNQTGSAATLQLDQAFGLTTIGPSARVDISGANSTFLAVNGVTDNQGYFRFANGHSFDAITGYANSGTTVIGNSSVLQVTGTLTNSGTIDVNRGGGIFISYTGNPSPRGAITSQIAQARHGGAWDQAGITSSSARDAIPKNTTLGVLEGTEYLALYGAGATFFGINVHDQSLLVKYTYYGDTDLNGVVNFDDYSRIDGGFNNGGTGWLNGDFDGNGQINFDDYSLIDLAFNTQGAPLVRAVPEPVTGLALIGLAALVTGARIRRRQG